MNAQMSGAFDPVEVHIQHFYPRVKESLLKRGIKLDRAWYETVVHSLRQRGAERGYWGPSRGFPGVNKLRYRFISEGLKRWKRQRLFHIYGMLMQAAQLDRNEIVDTDYRFSFSTDLAVTYTYIGAAICCLLHEAWSVDVKCMSCKTVEMGTRNTKLWNRLLLCGQCHALAVKAENELQAELDRAARRATDWLEQRVMSGGLLNACSDQERGSAGVDRFLERGDDSGTQNSGDA